MDKFKDLFAIEIEICPVLVNFAVKTVALKIGEHFAQENPWGKGLIGFLEGVTEEVK